MKKKILITDRFAQDSLLYLQQNSSFEVIRSDSPQHLPLEHLVTAHALLIRSRTQITEDLLKKARQLQLIITGTSGFDHIDLDATQRWGVTVMNTPNANVESAAQLTWSLVLACASQLLASHRMVKSGEWKRDKVTGLELSGRCYGVVGLGRIGSRVAQIAQAFGMNVIAFDPYQNDEAFEALKIKRANYDELLKNSDVISFHVPKTAETENMLGLSQLESIRRGVVLVNTSRGSVVKEQDLIKALESKWIRAAGLDVFEKEPLSKESQLVKFPNVIMTPHTGANTDEAFFKASQIAAQKLVAFFVDGSTSDTLPPRVAWYGATPFQKDEL